ncbi:MAG: hypothetical protein ACI4NG_04925 [Candidatus Gallimonas sp.]
MNKNLIARTGKGLFLLFGAAAVAGTALFFRGEARTVTAWTTKPTAGNITRTADTVIETVQPYLYTYTLEASNPDSVPFSSFSEQGKMTSDSWSSLEEDNKKFKAAVLYFALPTVTVPAHTAVTYQVSCSVTGKKGGDGNLGNITQYIAKADKVSMLQNQNIVVSDGANEATVLTSDSSEGLYHKKTLNIEERYSSEGNYALVNRSDEAKTFVPGNNLLYCAKVNYYTTGSGWFKVEWKSQLVISKISCKVTVSYETMTDDSGVSLTLDGNIGLNFYLDVDYYTDDKTASYVELTYNRNKDSYDTNRTTERLPLSALTAESGGRYKCIYKCTAYLTAGQLCDPVDLVLCDGAGNRLYEIKGYTAKTYLDAVINDDASDSDLKALCSALLAYGGAAQKYFGYSTDCLAADDAFIAACVGNVTAEDIPTTSSLTGAAEGFSLRAVSFLALDASSVRVYYRLDEGCSIEDYTVSVSDGFSVRLGEKTDAPYIEVYGISSVQLGEAFTLTVTKNGEAGGVAFTYSATDFAKQVISKNADPAKTEMFKALYLYYQAATTYFGR